MEQTELTKKFLDFLSLLKKGSLFSAIYGITEVLNDATGNEREIMRDILYQDRDSLQNLLLTSIPTITNFVAPLLNKEIPREQELVDFLFSINDNPHSWVIENISDNKKFQEKLFNIGIQERGKFSIEQNLAAISKLDANKIAYLITLQKNYKSEVLGRTAKDQIKKLIEKEDDIEKLRKIADEFFIRFL